MGRFAGCIQAILVQQQTAQEITSMVHVKGLNQMQVKMFPLTVQVTSGAFARCVWSVFVQQVEEAL